MGIDEDVVVDGVVVVGGGVVGVGVGLVSKCNGSSILNTGGAAFVEE